MALSVMGLAALILANDALPSEANPSQAPAAPAAASVPAHELRLVVYPTAGLEVSDRQLDIFERLLVDELNKRERIVAQAWLDALDQATPADQCRDDRNCLARLVTAVGANRVVSAKVNRVFDSDVITLRLVDPANADVLATVTRTVDADDGALSALGGAVEELVADHPRRQTTSPGVSAEVADRWNPAPFHPALFISGTTVSVGFLVLGIVFGLQAVDAADQHQALVRQAIQTPVSGRELVELEDRANSRSDLATGMWVGFGIAAGATILSIFFTDFGSDDVVFAASPEGGAVVGRF